MYINHIKGIKMVTKKKTPATPAEVKAIINTGKTPDKLLFKEGAEEKALEKTKLVVKARAKQTPAPDKLVIDKVGIVVGVKKAASKKTTLDGVKITKRTKVLIADQIDPAKNGIIKAGPTKYRMNKITTDQIKQQPLPPVGSMQFTKFSEFVDMFLGIMLRTNYEGNNGDCKELHRFFTAHPMARIENAPPVTVYEAFYEAKRRHDAEKEKTKQPLSVKETPENNGIFAQQCPGYFPTMQLMNFPILFPAKTSLSVAVAQSAVHMQTRHVLPDFKQAGNNRGHFDFGVVQSNLCYSVKNAANWEELQVRLEQGVDEIKKFLAKEQRPQLSEQERVATLFRKVVNSWRTFKAVTVTETASVLYQIRNYESGDVVATSDRNGGPISLVVVVTNDLALHVTKSDGCFSVGWCTGDDESNYKLGMYANITNHLLSKNFIISSNSRPTYDHLEYILVALPAQLRMQKATKS